MVDVYGVLLFGSRCCHALVGQAGAGDRVDVEGERQRDDVGLEPVDDGARLAARPAMRRSDGHGLPGLALPVRSERGVELAIELARGIVGDVQDGDGFAAWSRRRRSAARGSHGERSDADESCHFRLQAEDCRAWQNR